MERIEGTKKRQFPPQEEITRVLRTRGAQKIASGDITMVIRKNIRDESVVGQIIYIHASAKESGTRHGRIIATARVADIVDLTGPDVSEGLRDMHGEDRRNKKTTVPTTRRDHSSAQNQRRSENCKWRYHYGDSKKY